MGAPQVLLIDGHNPELAMATLTFGTDSARSDDDQADMDEAEENRLPRKYKPPCCGS